MPPWSRPVDRGAADSRSAADAFVNRGARTATLRPGGPCPQDVGDVDAWLPAEPIDRSLGRRSGRHEDDSVAGPRCRRPTGVTPATSNAWRAHAASWPSILSATD